jgi:hypothetical protein
MRRRNGGMRRADIVSAAEIGEFVYCPEAWRLRYGLGLEPWNRAALAAGDRHHAKMTPFGVRPTTSRQWRGDYSDRRVRKIPAGT